MTQSNTMLHARTCAFTLIVACAALTGCGSTPNTDQTQAAEMPAANQSQAAAMPMSSLSAMGSVYFGDTMSFGEAVSEEKPAVVASIQLEY